MREALLCPPPAVTASCLFKPFRRGAGAKSTCHILQTQIRVRATGTLAGSALAASR